MLWKECLSIFLFIFLLAIPAIIKLSECFCACSDETPKSFAVFFPLAIISIWVCTRALPDLTILFRWARSKPFFCMCMYVWFTGLNYLSFSLALAFKPFLVSIIDNKLASAHSNPKANLLDVFSVLSESSLSVLNSKPVACLQLGQLSVKHKSSYHKLSIWSRFVNAIPV